jgi:predicted RNA binding protein YcfA (HicA-like mRNA interferase family)
MRPWPSPYCIVQNDVYFIRIKARDILRALKAAGWREVRSNGSHPQLKHPDRTGLVTVPAHGADDLRPATLASIERQSGLKLRSK